MFWPFFLLSLLLAWLTCGDGDPTDGPVNSSQRRVDKHFSCGPHSRV
jgi:hypothetical protein